MLTREMMEPVKDLYITQIDRGAGYSLVRLIREEGHTLVSVPHVKVCYSNNPYYRDLILQNMEDFGAVLDLLSPMVVCI